MTVCYLTSQKVVLSINFCSLSLCLFLTHLPQFLNNLYGLGWFIHDHSVLWMCVHMRVRLCVCVRALGRPLECDSRPAQWQETPWRLWQAASCTPSFGFLSLTHFSSLCYSSTSTYISSSSFCICIHSIHTVPVFFFSFHSSTLCFLSGSQQDLNNWMFLILCFFVYFFLSQSVDESFYLCSGLPHLFLISPSLTIWFPCCDVSYPLSDPSGLYNLAQQALISKSYILSFTRFITPSHHPLTSWTSKEENYHCPRRKEHGWGVPTSHASTCIGIHLYSPSSLVRFSAS